MSPPAPTRRPAARSQLLLPALLALVAVIMLVGSLQPPEDASADRPRTAVGDPNDAAGKLDIARVRLDQDIRAVFLTVRFHGADLPPLRELRRFPARVGDADVRSLCLQVESGRLGRRLLCPGGRARNGKLEVGVSSYGSKGAARRRGTTEARIERMRSNPAEPTSLLKLRLSLGDLGPGGLRWAARSSWTSAECSTPTGRDGDPQACVDRAPGSDWAKLRLLALRRSGCTRADASLIRSGPSSKKRIALTFDDGPSTYTRRVMEILDRGGAKGTFFEIGSAVPGGSAVARELLRHGHELGNHSMGHELNPSDRSIRETSDRIEAATGFTPCTFRSPYGDVNSGVLGAARANGMSTVLWDVDTQDWTTPGSGTIFSRAVGGAHAGAIILMHDGGGNRSQTVGALPSIVSTLKARGYKLVTVTQLLGERYKWTEDR